MDREFPVVPGLHQVHLPGGLNVEAALQAYRGNPRVLYAEPDYRLQVSTSRMILASRNSGD